MREEIYDITGMHCAACSSAVERVTRKLDGVVQSQVNLPMKRLTIAYDEEKTTPDAIIAKIKKAGFGAQPHGQDAPASSLESKPQKPWGLLFALLCASLIFLLSMGSMLWLDMANYLGIVSPSRYPVNFALLQLLLCLPVLAYGKHFFTGGFSALFHGNPNMDTLVALSVSVSFVYSLVQTFLIATNPTQLPHLYFESAAMVVALVSVGKTLEARSQEKTKGAIAKLLRLAPDTAILVDEHGQWDVPRDFVQVKDTILVKAGASVPLDGVVTGGTASINEAMLTGESLPVEKTVGARVVGGSLCLTGAIFVEVSHTGSDTTLAKIIQFVEDAQGKKAPIARLADKVAGVFVPAVLAIATLAFVVWLVAGAELSFALNIFTSTLVIACPCAMGLATPMAMMVGTGLGARHGILIRNGEILERAQAVQTVIFDKTGTITKGEPVVTDMCSDQPETLLRLAYDLERLSEHPLSRAICRHAEAQVPKLDAQMQKIAQVSGGGIVGNDAQGKPVLLGNERLFSERGIALDAYKQQSDTWKQEGKTVIFVARAGEVLGMLALQDTVQTGAKETLAQLYALGIETVLLTGDHQRTAEHIGKPLGFGEIIAEVRPEEKAELVRAKQAQGKTVMMVGDGINDAVALSQADIGCAIGRGSDIAIDCADIVLMREDLQDVCRALHLSRHTLRNMKQNLFWAFCYNVLAIPIAMGVLYPSFGLLLNPMIGALAMSASSLFVVSNALRLQYKTLDKKG